MIGGDAVKGSTWDRNGGRSDEEFVSCY